PATGALSDRAREVGAFWAGAGALQSFSPSCGEPTLSWFRGQVHALPARCTAGGARPDLPEPVPGRRNRVYPSFSDRAADCDWAELAVLDLILYGVSRNARYSCGGGAVPCQISYGKCRSSCNNTTSNTRYDR